ncbi:MAG TPA: hypothetical protein VM347_20815, partial [Nonomuraea sp.]|nr:hypothetical protein [Nonomuraea sp.]
MFRSGTLTMILLGGTIVAASVAGCGATCAEGTEEVNGSCVATGVTCAPGTHREGNACVADNGENDGGGDGDNPRPDRDGGNPPPDEDGGPPPDQFRGCIDDPDICGQGLQCNMAANVCEIDVAARTEVTGITDPPQAENPDLSQFVGSGDPAFAIEGDKLVMYYILGGGPEGSGLPDILAAQTNGRKQQQVPLNQARVEIDPETLSRVDDPEELTEFRCPTITFAVQSDALTAVFSCPRECYGLLPVGPNDLCVARRDKAINDDGSRVPWGQISVLTESSRNEVLERDPFWIYNAGGDPTGLGWVANPGDAPVGSNVAVVCYADWDPQADADCWDIESETMSKCKGNVVNTTKDGNGQPVCERYKAPGSGPVVVSDPFFSVTCPEWRPDMRYFIWGRSGLGTEKFDLFGAGSSK